MKIVMKAGHGISSVNYELDPEALHALFTAAALEANLVKQTSIDNRRYRPV